MGIYIFSLLLTANGMPIFKVCRNKENRLSGIYKWLFWKGFNFEKVIATFSKTKVVVLTGNAVGYGLVFSPFCKLIFESDLVF